jgi:hypothetical protein
MEVRVTEFEKGRRAGLIEAAEIVEHVIATGYDDEPRAASFVRDRIRAAAEAIKP